MDAFDFEGLRDSGRDRRLAVHLAAPLASWRTGGWRDGAAEGLPMGLVEALETSGFQVFSSHQAQNQDLFSGPGQSASAVRREFSWMEVCDAFVAVLPRDFTGDLVPASSVHLRLGWASSLKKPVLVVADGLPGPDSPPLLRGLAALTRVEYTGLTEVMARPAGLVRQLLALLDPRTAPRTAHACPPSLAPSQVCLS